LTPVKTLRPRASYSLTTIDYSEYSPMTPKRPAARTGRALWRKQHHLGRMGLRELVHAFFGHYAIQAYLLLFVASLILFAMHPMDAPRSWATISLVILAYPLVWYALHRWVLHARWMFRVPALAGVWKRIHYDHHMDPDHLEVLLGALRTTLPTILLVSALPGWLIGGTSGALLGFATGLAMTGFYEFCHCIQHLGYKPRHPALVAMKARHMEHHFHDEDGNFGITNFAWDKLFGTYYRRPERPRKSSTVFNLGYDEAMARRYPRVFQLGSRAPSSRRQRLREGGRS
jgi:sterol desaturase/sphingolipid hydroxylase (fatty acid hydroxylase superfamily)